MNIEERQALITHAQEWIKETEECRDEIPFGLSDESEKELQLIKIALASLLAEPVGNFYEDGKDNWWQLGPHDKVPHVTPLYANPPTPADSDLIRVINRLLDSDGSRGTFSAIKCLDARQEIERFLAAAPEPGGAA